MEGYFIIAVFAIAGFLFPLLNVGVSRLLRRDYPYPEKVSTYESGEIPFGDARIKFPIHYYIFALLFLIFDIETVFLFPWAVAFENLPQGIAFAEMTIFIGMLVIGLIYAWKKKVLTWL